MTKTPDTAQSIFPPALHDFRNFLFLVWKHLGLPPPTPVQYAIAEWLQHGPRRKITLAFRGVGKSWVTAAFAVWLLGMNPEERIMVVSAGQDRATQFSIFVKRLIAEMDILEPLRPRDGQRTSMMAFDVGLASNSQSPSVKSVGITGQITGSRATRIIADDIEVPSNSDTVLKRDKLAELIKEFDAVLVPGGTTDYLGTPQTEESIYYKRLPERGYQVRVWPARVPDTAGVEKYGGYLAPMIHEMIEKGAKPRTPVDPKRFNEEELTERELSYGRSGFALQFQLDPLLSDVERYPLKLKDFIVLPVAHSDVAPVKLSWGSSPDLMVQNLPLPGFTGDHWFRPFFVSKDWAPFQGAVMAIDPSGRGKDELGVAVVKMLNGNLYVTKVRGFLGGYVEKNLVALAEMARDQQVKHIVIEENFGGGMFAALFEPVLGRIYPCTIEEVHSSIQKEKRIIDTLEPVLNQHRLIIDEQLVKDDQENYNGHALERARDYQLLHQLTHITRDKNSLRQDDRLDALAIAVAYWVDQMRKDDRKAVSEHRQMMMEKEIREHLEFAIGKPVGSDRWIPMW